jgi:hypothetical protein
VKPAKELVREVGLAVQPPDLSFGRSAGRVRGTSAAAPPRYAIHSRGFIQSFHPRQRQCLRYCETERFRGLRLTIEFHGLLNWLTLPYNRSLPGYGSDMWTGTHDDIGATRRLQPLERHIEEGIQWVLAAPFVSGANRSSTSKLHQTK